MCKDIQDTFEMGFSLNSMASHQVKISYGGILHGGGEC